MLNIGHRNLGFTIIELVIASVIALLAIGSLFCVVFFIQDNIEIVTGILGISEKGRIAINRISKDALSAKSVVSSHTYAGTVYFSDYDTVVLRIPSINASGDIIDSEHKFDYTIYTLNNRDLLRIVDADIASSRNDGTETVARDIDSVEFSYSTKSIAVKIITSAALGVKEASRSNQIVTSVSLRNEKRGL